MEGEADGLVGDGSGAPAGGIVIGDDGLPVNVDQEAKEETIPLEILEDMKNVWDVFDMEATDKIPIKELRTIMRALDIDLDPKELEIVRK